MYFTGIADEAGKDIDTQIKSHKELGWSHVELRNVVSGQWTDVSDTEFDEICGKLDKAGIKVSCFASGIANWATKITQPLENDIAILERSIPRMKKIGTQFIRAMSWPNDDLPEDEWRDAAVSRMKKLAKIAEQGGVTIVVENCDGWASASAEKYGKFFELVGSPAVKAVYDTGNAAAHGYTDTWDWYQAAKPHIAYIHIKSSATPGKQTWPDEGVSMVLETVKDLLAGGYDNGFSIEPHMQAVVHLGKEITDAEAAYSTYVEYGRRMMALVKKAKA